MRNIRRTAAGIAAASLYEMLPGVELLGGGETEIGFFYQFFYTNPLVPEIRSMIEERMRQIVREKRPLREMEMVACSAKELFQKEGHPSAVDALEDLEPKELVSVLRIGGFVDLLEGPFCSTVGEVGAFQIVSIESLGDQEYRLEGCATATKDELKALLRKLAKYEKENHLVLGQTLGLWKLFGRRIVWLEKGLRSRRALIQWLKEKLCANAQEAAADDRSLLSQWAVASGKPTWSLISRTADPEGDAGLFEEICQSRLELLISVENSNSLLQTIEETLMILGFHPFLCSQGQGRGGNGKEWTVEDGLGRSHVAVALSSDASLWRMSLGIEKILALLLERTAGDLPSWLRIENRTLLENQ